MGIGERVRALRKEQKLGLDELAQRSGLALATLSRLENGKQPGTFRTHQKIAQVLGVPVTELYKELKDAEAQPTVVAEDSPDVERFNYEEKATAVLLAHQVTGRRILPQMLILQPGGKTAVEQYRAGTERWLYGLEGQTEVRVGTRRHRVEKGQAISFKGSLEHQFRNAGRGVAKTILVTSPVVL